MRRAQAAENSDYIMKLAVEIYVQIFFKYMLCYHPLRQISVQHNRQNISLEIMLRCVSKLH